MSSAMVRRTAHLDAGGHPRSAATRSRHGRRSAAGLLDALAVFMWLGGAIISLSGERPEQVSGS